MNSHWHNRRYLPHFESNAHIQHVTIRLADSIPPAIREKAEQELNNLPPEKQPSELRKRLEDILDTGYGSCILRHDFAAQILRDSLLSFHDKRYILHAWVIMPNHAHILLEPLKDWKLQRIVGSLKQWSARHIREKNAALERGAPGAFWQREYWDRYIRDQRHFEQAIEYIHHNPVKARLTTRPESWPWSSAHLPSHE